MGRKTRKHEIGILTGRRRLGRICKHLGILFNPLLPNDLQLVPERLVLPHHNRPVVFFRDMLASRSSHFGTQLGLCDQRKKPLCQDIQINTHL